MKNIFLLLILFMASLHKMNGQEIIPFPDIGGNHLAVYNQSEMIDEHNYSLYTREYRDALQKIDLEIDLMEKSILNEQDPTRKANLEKDRKELIDKRKSLLQEADLIDDLNKFY